MKRLFALAACILCVFVMSACSMPSPAEDGVLKIVVTAFPHYDFARQLTKDVDNVEIKMLISPGSEVHTYEPSPSDILAISECDLFIMTGGESETWVEGIVESSGNKQMQIISLMEICEGSETDTEHDGHEHEYDEHVWTSPKNALLISKHIADALCRTDKDSSDKIKENYEHYTSLLTDIIIDFEDMAKSTARNGFVVADRFPFYHMAHEFGLEYHSAYPGCSHSTEPNAHVIAELANKVKNENIPYVFTIEFSNNKIANSIIEGTDAKILTLHSCHNVSKEDFENGVTYYDLMKQNAANLRKALCE